MNKGLTRSVHKAMSENLEPGETVQLVGGAMVGQMSATKNMAQALIVGAVTLGTVAAWRRPQKLFLALTDRRLVFLVGNAHTGRATSKVAAALPRAGLTTVGSRTKMVMFVIPTLLVDLAVNGSDQGLRLQFPTAARAEGAQIAAALGPSSV